MGCVQGWRIGAGGGWGWVGWGEGGVRAGGEIVEACDLI